MKTIEEFIQENKYLRDKKYHKGIGFSQTILGGGSCCMICGVDGAEHTITHDRKTNGKAIHNGDICYSCARQVRDKLGQGYWKSLDRIRNKIKKK